MKNLNLILVILIGLSILSCSSDDENKISQDLIIGIWKPVKFVEVFRDAGEIVEESSSCYQQGRISFYSNGEYSHRFFVENSSRECIENNSDNLVGGTWEKKEGYGYEIEPYYFNTQIQEYYYLIEELDQITFTNANSMRMIFFAGYEVNGDFLKYYYQEYSRVE